MPIFLEKILKKEYGAKSPRVWATLNHLGLMKGNKITAKGRALQAKHERDMALKRKK